MNRPTMILNGRYNWISQPERLVYVGYNWSGNGYWHQFEKVDAPGVVWCEVLDHDLHRLEETIDSPPVPEGHVDPALSDEPVQGRHTKWEKSQASDKSFVKGRHGRRAASEIDVWNAAVDQRKADKLARKAARSALEKTS